MQNTIFNSQKVNNEYEICEISSLEVKQQIEKVLLQNRISYFIRWPKRKLFSRHKVLCVLCVNESSRETAEEAIKGLGSNVTDEVRFIVRKSTNDFL
ncbi:MAG: hypothetical protein IJW63_10700 [Lachnospiraceae bacterium]|nr:hypothetical protein [Lachnospiraceae bacterium]